MATLVKSDFGEIDIEAREAMNSGGVAIFNPAIKATLTDGGNPVIILGVDGGQVLTVDVDGKLHWIPVTRVQLDWRYDFKKEAWVDGNNVNLEVDGES